jgi:hypothetical protein
MSWHDVLPWLKDHLIAFMHEPITCGFLGALAVKALDFLEPVSDPVKWPDFKNWPYWFTFLVAPTLGAFVVFLYTSSGMELKPIVAANIGISAPIILRSWSQKKEGVPPPLAGDIPPGA